MKKKRMFDTKGFMLVETLLVSLTISGVLVYMYAQFSTINNAYQRLYDFNTSNSLYRAAALREFMMMYTDKYGVLYSGLTAKTIKNDCSNMSITFQKDKNYCKGLISALDAKKIILTNDKFNRTDVLDEVSDAKEKTKLDKFLNTIQQHDSTKKRLIIIFNDGTMATVLLGF
jgi:hypothetical protein